MNIEDMTKNELYSYITDLFDLLKESGANTDRFKGYWEFITIGSDSIRLDSYEDAVDLAGRMELVYQDSLLR